MNQTNPNYQLEKCEEDSIWDHFLSNSPQKNVFSTSAFLNEMPISVERWFLKEKAQILAAAIVPTSQGKALKGIQPYTLYQGIFLAGSLRELPIHSQAKKGLEVLGAFLVSLEEKYSSLSLCLHPELGDLRAFQWHNYGKESNRLFQLTLYYTGLINLKNYPTFEQYLKAIRNTRRQEHQKGISCGLFVDNSTDVSLLADLHSKTFERQGVVLEDGFTKRLISISENALKKGFGELQICWTKEKQPASATLFLKYADTAYYLFGANDPAFRKLNCGTFLMLENMRLFLEQGLSQVDMVGINSPNRGDFKTSFNAEPIPYYLATLGL